MNHKKSLIESHLLSPTCTIAFEEYFAEDEEAHDDHVPLHGQSFLFHYHHL
jgi:hypothetical protein